jgi:molybdopterin molybdotransferase
MTGAPLPEGTDLVIPYEHLKISDAVAVIVAEQERRPMENVHLFGSDTKASAIVLKAGTEMNGPAWGIAASMGKLKIKTKKRPSVNIISTGDELVGIDELPLPHQIRRSNAYALKASLMEHGYREIELSHLDDQVEAIRKHFEENSRRFDLMIYSGGVSKGKFDFLPSVWKESGVKEIFHGVSQRPGKPLWFGVHEKTNTAVIGLPGNPVSSLVCLHRYLLSAKPVYAVLSKEIIFKNNLTYFVPAKLESSPDGRLLAHPLPVQNSGEFTGLAGSDGFLELPKDQQVFSAGEVFLFHSWGKM